MLILLHHAKALSMTAGWALDEVPLHQTHDNQTLNADDLT